MRKYLLLLALLPCVLRAQEGKDRSWIGLNDALTLWASSSNAAGLAVSPYRVYNTLSARYGYEEGDWRVMQDGTNVSGFNFDTQGARQVGRIQLWGRFSYDNINEKGGSYNTLLYDPHDERFMYSAADTVAGQWKKQSYRMQFKAAMPLGERFAAGVHVNYTDKIAAGQIDPRAESYHYAVDVKPGLVWIAGASRIGINGLYSNTFERSTPSISNTQEIQKVFLMRGLGNWVGEQVGSSGLSTMYFRCNSYGGALQYAFDGSWKMLAELSYTRHATRITESATQPKPHGRTLQQEFGLNAAAVYGKDAFIDKITLEASHVLTNGIEPTALWNTATGEWEIQNELDQCRFNTTVLDVRYDRYLKDGGGFKWHLKSGMGFKTVHDSYATPYSEFQYGIMSAFLGAEYKFIIGKGSLLAGPTVKAAKNLGNALYDYNGHRAGTAPVQELYPHNLSVLCSDRLSTRVAAEYAFPVGKDLRLAFSGEAEVLFAFGPDDTDPSGVTLRDRGYILGAVKLYF